ncbi:MAG: hypothetical protein IJ243_09505 [Prevotella sp.]|nr:hypothetical protein [Prevotella sp.]
MFDDFQKSTPQKNLALTFEFLTCLQKHKKGQKMSKNRAQNHGVCAKNRLLALLFSSGEAFTGLQNGYFPPKNATSP